VSAAPARIVLVNDDEVQLRVIGDVLRSGGYRVRAYADPEVAVRRLGGGEPADLLVVDLNMPGIDGWRLCRFIRSGAVPSLQTVPILVLSATFSGVDVEAITSALGADGFLSIPFRPGTLLGAVADVIDGRGHRVRRHAVYLHRGEPPPAELVERMDALGYQLSVHDDPRSISFTPEPHVALVEVTSSDRDLVRTLARPGGQTVVVGVVPEADPDAFMRLLKWGADAVTTRPLHVDRVAELVVETARERAMLRVAEVLEIRTHELASSERRYRSLFESVPEAVLLLDREGRILRVNEQGLTLFRRRGLEPVGRMLSEVAPEIHRTARNALEETWSRGVGSFELRIASEAVGQREFIVSARITEVHGEAALLAVARDVTERRQAEDERRQLEARIARTQKLESLGVLAGGMAHDFNNLLVSMLGNASLARYELEGEHPAQEALQEIEVAARRASELTAQILDYSGVAAVQPARVDLSALVQEMTRLLEPAVSKKAELRVEPGEGSPLVDGSPGQLRQVVMNLITNASDAVGQGRGRIELRTGVRYLDTSLPDDGQLWMDVEPGEYAYLEVEDDGIGMEESVQQRIFDPFFTTKENGRGLGLAATLGIVRSHGGTLFLKSVPGQGSTFRVYFPLVEDDASEPGAERVEGAGPGYEPAAETPHRGAEAAVEPHTVLVVDDEPVVRRVAVLLLKRFGYQVLEADDGLEALRAYRANRHRISAVMLDLLMPEMDGAETLHHLREEDPGIRAMVCSGFVADSVARELREGGPVALLPKPYDSSELRATLERMFRDEWLPEEFAADPGEPCLRLVT
jgi:PAS domain S-box-containing protein